MVVPCVHPPHRPPVRRGIFGYRTRPFGREVHRHESLGAWRHRPQLGLRAHERHGYAARIPHLESLEQKDHRPTAADRVQSSSTFQEVAKGCIVSQLNSPRCMYVHEPSKWGGPVVVGGGGDLFFEKTTFGGFGLKGVSIQVAFL